MGKSPADVLAWWMANGANRDYLMRTYPEILGNLDGIPAADRHLMNRSRIMRERVLLESEIARYESDEMKYLVGTNLKLEELRAKLASLNLVDSSTNGSATGQGYLLYLDLKGGVAKAAVALGDVDSADHVGVVVGGVGTTVDGGMGKLLDQLGGLRSLMDARFGEPNTAMVAWMGYEAPSDIFTKDGMTGYRAQEGARALASFERGLDATHAGALDLTTAGHSYGSAVAGISAEQDSRTDRLILFGSGGEGSGAKLVPDGNMFVMRSDDDVIGDFQWATNRVLGNDPFNDPAFQRLETQASESLGTATASGHGGYLDSGTTSQWNLAAIISGHPERAVND